LGEHKRWTGGFRSWGRTGRARLTSLAVMVVTLSIAPYVASPSQAAFTKTTNNTSNTFTADTVTPPSGLGASTGCLPALTPTYRASTTRAPGSSGTSITLTTPTTSIGDYLIAVVMLETTGHAMNTPAGWTLLQSQSNSDMVVTAYAMATPASPAANYTFTWTGGVYATGILAAYSGTSAVQTSGSQSNGDSLTSTAPSVTVTSTPATLLTVLNHDADDTPDSTPAGMTYRDDVDDVNGFNYDETALYDQTLAATGPTGTRTGTNNYSDTGISVGISIVLSGTSSANDSATLSWTATPYANATGYEIIRDGSGTTSVSGRTTTTWTDTTTSGTAHSYALSAVFGNWRSSVLSTSISACP
jgi:hypothetical protein